jgi:hypothetical protein
MLLMTPGFVINLFHELGVVERVGIPAQGRVCDDVRALGFEVHARRLRLLAVPVFGKDA